MRTANPALSERVWRHEGHAHTSGSMTIDGTMNKALLLFLVLMVPAAYVWVNMASLLESGLLSPLLFGSIILGFIVAIITIFTPRYAMYTSPVYAFLEGIVLGGISALLEQSYPVIVVQAMALTFGTTFIMLMLYRSRTLRATKGFRMGVLAATGGIALVYLVSIIGGMFGLNIPFIHGSGPIGIGFSLFVVVVAALNLVLDFDFIERGAKQRAPKHMELDVFLGICTLTFK